MSIHWHLEVLRISDLKENEKNPRKITKEQQLKLEELIKKYGLIDKPIVNKDWTIIGGHQRVRILKKMKAKNVECWIPDVQLNQDDIDRLCIGLNLNQGTWDYDILANEYDALELLEWGFTEEQLLGVTKEAEAAAEAIAIDEEDDEEQEIPKNPVTQKGDLYILGDHRLLCGDSTMPDDVAKVLGGAEPILMVTDPPYGVNYDASWRDVAGKGHRAKGKVQNDDKVNWALTWSIFPGSVAYVWYASLFHSEVEKSLIDSDFDLISHIIWAKQHFALSRGDYHWQHESCLYSVKRGQKHNWQGSRKESTLWEVKNLNCFGKSREEGEERTPHSTQKPLECMARPIRNNTAVGEGVYDPFVGSGTTLIAAEQLGRKCYAIEIDPIYCDVVVNRWINYRKKKGLHCEFSRNGISMSSLENEKINEKE